MLLAELEAARRRAARGARGAWRSAVLVRGEPSAVFHLVMRTDASRYEWDGLLPHVPSLPP